MRQFTLDRLIAGWLLMLVVAAGSPAGSAVSELHRYEAVEPHMGTLVRITLYTPDEDTARKGFRAAFERIHELDRILSDYRPDSELNGVTAGPIGRPVPVGRDLFVVLRASQDLAAATDGAFDVTQGPIVRLWREARKTNRLPNPVALREAAARSGYRRLHLDDRHRTVMVDMAGMALDVGAIGKGYAASEAIAVLKGLGITQALVAVSGDLAFGAPPPGRKGWRIRVSSAEAPAVPHVLELTDLAVSTAGAREQHVDVDGRRYSHVIDPASGMGLLEDVTVTVIAPHGLIADGLDTAISVVGLERGLALIESRPDTAALIVKGGESGTVAFQSSRFRELAARYQPAPLGTR